jgi:hypothetical protein
VGGSGYFDGNGDWLNPNATSANLALGSGDFTIEFWLNTSRGATRQYIFDFRNNGSTGSISPTTAPALIWGDDGADNNGNWLRYVSLSNGSIAASADLLGVTLSTISNQWNHIAVVRSSGTVYGYLNGVRKNSVADSTNFNVNCSVSIAAVFLGSANYLGNISDFRVVKGTAVYTGTTYTVPTAPLTAITNTQLLLNYTNAGVVDATAKNVLETVGTAQISNTTSKFPPTSIYLSGDGNYLTSRSSPVFSLNGDFTMEAWVYPINAGRSADAEKYGTIVSCAAVGVSNPEFSWFIRIVGGVVTEYFLNLNFTTVLQVTGLSVSLNAWHYFAVTRSGTGTGNLKLYIDGTLVGTSSGAVTQSATFTSAQTLMVGRNAGSTAYQNWLSGYFQDVRITPGYVRTVTTVPTAPFPVQ